ncbi:MAG: hypothetical protein ACRDGM_05870 [bacterium]
MMYAAILALAGANILSAPLSEERPALVFTLPAFCSALTVKLAEGIARIENVRPALNNPGGLMVVPGRPLKYATFAEGHAALEAALTRYIARGHSIDSLVRRWAPDGNHAKYSRLLARAAGIRQDIPIAEACE